MMMGWHNMGTDMKLLAIVIGSCVVVIGVIQALVYFLAK